MMEVKEIRRLLRALAESEVREFTLDTGDYKLNIKRGAETVVTAAAAPPAAPLAPAEPPTAETPAAAEASAPEAAAAPEQPSQGQDLTEVLAPIVGTFYAAPSPEAPPFVRVGDRVTAGTVLCIIEAMKLMNEIEAEVTGVVREVAVSNEDPVEYGQVLFRIEQE